MPASEELRYGTVDDDFESCEEGDGESGAPLWVANIRHSAAVRISGHARM